MDLPILERRRIEAEILKHVYEVLSETHGRDVAVATIDQAVTRAAIAHGAKLRDALGHEPDLADFAALQPAWTANGALEVTVRHADAGRFDYDVTRCRYAEMYREMGLGEIGHILSCNRDGRFCEGYSPSVKFERTQTIMQGASHCDFRYSLPEEERARG